MINVFRRNPDQACLIVVIARLPMKKCVFFANVIKALPAQLQGCGTESILCCILCKEKTNTSSEVKTSILLSAAL